MGQQFNEPLNIAHTAERSLVIGSRTFEEARSNPEREVHVPQLFVPDPIGVNPNSVSNVRKVLFKT